MEKIQRNDPCPCGSGKKFKKCCIDKKPRTTRIKFDFEEPVTIDSPDCLIFNNGQFQIRDVNGKIQTPEKTNVTTFYDRKKKKKILNALQFDGNHLMDIHTAMLANYNAVFAIDTNTYIENDKSISLSCIIRIIYDEPSNQFFLIPLRFYEFRNSCSKIENVAWCILIQELMADMEKIDESYKIGLVVDSDLGNFDNFQSRKEPIIDDFFLPECISLIYAGSDSGGEFLLNKAIKASDKWSNEIKTMMKPTYEDYFHIVENTHFDKFRCQNAKLQATEIKTGKELFQDVENLFAGMLNATEYSIGLKALYIPDNPSCKIQI